MAETPRKRKLKFAEKELEVLTGECCQHHEQLFGRAALSVPEVEKKRIWTDIQDKVNSMGVSHRSIEDLKKLWYDLRSRTKERMAERLREMRGTGGGPSTIPPPTPLEERVEETLEPEAVCGMGELDTSEPGPSTGLPHYTTASQSIQEPQVSHQPAEESGPATTETCTTHTQSPHDAPVAILMSEPAPGPSHSATVDDTEPPLRRR
ncbi:nuclear apoptosis-inducing factor 1-like [Pleurodeles waltl]|uniref:nuclear apoptosis-inducing factor 1-like n=1 Tax=Pleurodeles waltl TaxID=8319 RepID=UPI003709596C